MNLGGGYSNYGSGRSPVAALVGVFVFVLAVSPSLLIGHPPKGLSAADELTARK